MVKNNKIQTKISKENLSNLIDTIRDLSNIDDKIVFKFNKDDILIYTLVGQGKSINAFKSFIYNKSLFYTDYEVNDTIIYIANSGKLLVKNLKTILEFDDDVDITITFDTINNKLYSDKIQFKSGNKLKLSFNGADPLSTNTQITNEHIKDLADIKNCEFSFNLNSEDFLKIKRLASPDTDMNIFYLNTKKRENKYYISIGENNWDLEVDSVDNIDDEITLAFPKKYFKSINIENNICKIYIFNTFLMVYNENSNFLISMEITV